TTLQNVHCTSGFATSLSLHWKFLTTKKAKTQSIQGWIGTIQSLAFWMEQAEIDVSEQDCILMMTMGLPSSYNNLI
ncbi:hypothetical protein BDQ12DRAFT_578312, partial [Crucibulum laeve]